MKELKRKDVCRKTNLDQEWISARDIFVEKPAIQLLRKPILLFTRMSALGRYRTCLLSAKSGHSAEESLTERIS